MALMLHVATTKKHPGFPPPDRLSGPGQAFLDKCFQRDPKVGG